MSQPIALPAPILIHMGGALSVPMKGLTSEGLTSVIGLLDEGGTVPIGGR